MKDDIRITNVTISYEDKISIEYIYKLNKFLERYKHLDIPLSIIVEANDFDEDNFYDVISLLNGIDGARLSIRSMFLNKKESTLKLIREIADEIIFRVKENFNDYNEDLFFLSSSGKTTVELKVDESNVDDLKKFTEVFMEMEVRNTYKIDYFSKYIDPKGFFEKLKENPANGVLYRKQYPKLAICLFADGTIRYLSNKSSKMNGILADLNKDDYLSINEDVMGKNISHYNRMSEKCMSCNTYDICHGGNNILFTETDNEELFCATQRLIRWRLG